jgi:hypothetical protein
MVKTNITQPSFVGGIISQELFSRLDLQKLDSGLKQCENFVIRPSGGAVYRVGTKYIAETKYKNKKVKLIPFVYNRTDGLCLEFGDKYIRFYKDGKQVLNQDGSVYELETSYDEKHVQELSYAQDKNNLYIAHQKYTPAVLTRNSDNDWVLKTLTLNPTVSTVSAVTIEKTKAKKEDDIVNFDKWQYAVSIVYTDDVESFATYSNIIESDIDLLNQPINVTWTVPEFVDLESVQQFNIYRIKAGEFYQCYTEYPKEETRSYTVKDISFSQDTTLSPREKFEDFGEDNYPAVVGIWNQRLVFGNTPDKPSTFWLSRAGQLEDFSSTILQTAADPISLTLNSGTLDAIVGFIPMDNLILLTEGKIWRITGTSADNMAAYIESYTGSSSIKPTATKKSAMFVDSSLNSVSDFVYSDELNGYTGQNLDLLARELIDGYTISDLAFKDTPYGVLYCVRDDGVLLGLTYLREQNIYAWHKHTTKDGKFLNVCSIDKNKQDNVYCAINRDGIVYIEMFASYINENENEDNSCHLDCSSKVVSGWYSYRNVETVSDKEYKSYDGIKECGLDSIYSQTPITIYIDGSAVVGSKTYIKNSDGDLEFFADIDDIQGGQLHLARDYKDWNYEEWGDVVGTGMSAVPQDEKRDDDFAYCLLTRTSKGCLVTVFDPNEDKMPTRQEVLDSPFYNIAVTEEYNSAFYTTTTNHGNFEVSVWAPAIAKDLDDRIAYYYRDKVVRNIRFTTLEFWKWGNLYKGLYSTVVENDKMKSSISSFFLRNSAGDYSSGTFDIYDYKYVSGTPEVGMPAYDDPFGNVSYNIEGVIDGGMIVNGKEYYYYSPASSVDSVSGLDRFNDKEITLLIDGDVYENCLVTDGTIKLPVLGSSILVGLPYTGIIETIPYDRVFSSGNSSVGYNRRITKGELSYYRTRGLKYGTSMNNLYEIKSYRDEEFGERMSLETNVLTLDVASGFSKENTFFVVQDKPLPALVRNITLGSKLNG